MRRLLSALLYSLMIAAGGGGLIAMFMNFDGLISIRLIGGCIFILLFGFYLSWEEFVAPVLSRRYAHRRFQQAFAKGKIDLRTVSLLVYDKLKPWDNQTLGLRALAACRTYSSEGRILKQSESREVNRCNLCTLRGQFGFYYFADPLSPTGC
jgi:hypothetical protein